MCSGILLTYSSLVTTAYGQSNPNPKHKKRDKHTKTEREQAARHAYTLACFNIYEQGRMRGGHFARFVGHSPPSRRRVLLHNYACFFCIRLGVFLRSFRGGIVRSGVWGRQVWDLSVKLGSELAHPFVVLRQTDVAFVVETELTLYPWLAGNKYIFLC